MIVNTIKVTSAGTRVQASDSGTVRSIVFHARPDNVGNVYVGDSNVSSTRGVCLAPSGTFRMVFENYGKVKNWYADVDTSNDEVDYVADNS